MSKHNFPDFIVHYSRGEPFRSITSVPQEQIQNIIENLSPTTAWGINRFKNPTYLSQRVHVENQVRDAFIAKGGRPQLKHPIYFFLGRNQSFEENRLNRGYRINLDRILPEYISFTYGDSMLAFVEENKMKSGPQYMNQLCERVYRLEELDYIYSSAHFPKQDPLAIEAQIWFLPSREIIEMID